MMQRKTKSRVGRTRFALGLACIGLSLSSGAAIGFAEGTCVDAARLMKEAVELADGSEREETLYREAMTACPNMSEAHHNLAVLLHRRGDRAGAKLEIDRAIELSDTTTFRLTRAGIFLDSADYQLALDEYQILLAKKGALVDPDLSRALQGAAFSLEKMGRREEALKIVAERVDQSGVSAATMYLHAVLLSKLGMNDEALRSYERTVELEPNHLEALQNLGVALARRGKYELSLRWLTRAADLKPNDPAILSALGGTYEGMGDFDKAAINLQKAQELKPDDTAIAVNLAVVLMQKKQEGLAEELLVRTIAREPHNSRALATLGWARLELGKYSAAEADLKAAIEQDATNALAHHNMGVLFQRLGRNEEAVVEFKTALKHSPDLEVTKQALATLGK